MEWSISAFVAHCLFVALDSSKERSIKENPLWEIWRAAFQPFAEMRGNPHNGHSGGSEATAITVPPLESDKLFFANIIEDGLARLSHLSSDSLLPCGHAVQEHIQALIQWQEKNLST